MQPAAQTNPLNVPATFSLKVNGRIYWIFWCLSTFYVMNIIFGALRGYIGCGSFFAGLFALFFFWVGRSSKHIEYEEGRRYLEVTFGPSSFFNLMQKCCCLHRGRVEFDSIQRVELGRTNCCDGAFVNCNRCTLDWTYSVGCCTDAVIVYNDDDKKYCCHSGRRKLGVSTRGEAFELKTFIESKMIEANNARQQARNNNYYQQNFAAPAQQYNVPNQQNFAAPAQQYNGPNNGTYPQAPVFQPQNPAARPQNYGQERQSRPFVRSGSPQIVRSGSPVIRNSSPHTAIRNSSPHTTNVRNSSPVGVRNQSPHRPAPMYPQVAPPTYPQVRNISTDQKQPLISQQVNSGGHLFVNQAPNPIQAAVIQYEPINDPTIDSQGRALRYQPPANNNGSNLV